MTRELKFRAWANGYEKWCEWIDYNVAVWIGTVNTTKRNYTTTDVTVEQYTGLKDKNGKEIYEGDIVKVEDNLLSDYNKFFGENSVVKSTWSKGGACTIHNWYGDRVLNLDIWLNCVEVIGNIHENPELLGGEEKCTPKTGR